MSIRNFLNDDENLCFQNIDCYDLIANDINGNTGNTGSTGPILILTSSDNSIGVSGSTGNYDIYGSGSEWSKKPATGHIEFASFPLTNTDFIQFTAHFGGPYQSKLYQGNTGGLFISTQTGSSSLIGQIYDSKFNPPTASGIADVLGASSDAGTIGITGINSLELKSLILGNTGYTPPPLTKYTFYSHPVLLTHHNALSTYWNGSNNYYIYVMANLNLPSENIYSLRFELQFLKLYFASEYSNTTVDDLHLAIINVNSSNIFFPNYYSIPIKTTVLNNVSSVSYNIDTLSYGYIYTKDTPIPQNGGVQIILFTQNPAIMYPITYFDLVGFIKYNNVIIKSA